MWLSFIRNLFILTIDLLTWHWQEGNNRTLRYSYKGRDFKYQGPGTGKPTLSTLHGVAWNGLYIVKVVAEFQQMAYFL